MGRAPCCEKVGLKRGRWTAEEDESLRKYIVTNGEGSWRSLPKNAGLLRCGKSCRLRWINYLKSNVKRGNISTEEEQIIINLHASMGNRWSLIAGHLPGRTDNEIKNYWNSHLSRKIHSYRTNPNFIPPPAVTDSASKPNKRTRKSATKNTKKPSEQKDDHKRTANAENVMPTTPAVEKEAVTIPTEKTIIFEPSKEGIETLETECMEKGSCENIEMENMTNLCLDDILADVKEILDMDKDEMECSTKDESGPGNFNWNLNPGSLDTEEWQFLSSPGNSSGIGWDFDDALFSGILDMNEEKNSVVDGNKPENEIHYENHNDLIAWLFS